MKNFRDIVESLTLEIAVAFEQVDLRAASVKKEAGIIRFASHRTNLWFADNCLVIKAR